MTPITWQAAVDDEEQRPLLQDILEAAVPTPIPPEFSGCSPWTKLPMLWLRGAKP